MHKQSVIPLDLIILQNMSKIVHNRASEIPKPRIPFEFTVMFNSVTGLGLKTTDIELKSTLINDSIFGC